MLKLINGTLVRRAWQPPEPTVDKKERKDGSRSVLRKRGQRPCKSISLALVFFVQGSVIGGSRDPVELPCRLSPRATRKAGPGLKKRLLVHRCSSLRCGREVIAQDGSSPPTTRHQEPATRQQPGRRS